LPGAAASTRDRYFTCPWYSAWTTAEIVRSVH
jgi:hypothetical protein